MDTPTNNSWAEFFSEGFFGYGEQGNFTKYSFWRAKLLIFAKKRKKKARPSWKAGWKRKWAVRNSCRL